MKRVGKPVFFIVVLLIALFTYAAFFGISSTFGDNTTTYIKGANEIRWGIDIRGGVDVTFSPPDGVDATDAQMDSATSVIKQRLLSLNITDSEVYTDYNRDRIIVRFPWKSDEKNFDPEAAIAELGETALLTFREGINVDETTGEPTGVTKDNVILQGEDIKSAFASMNEKNQYVVVLELNESGKGKFAEATGRLVSESYPNNIISIWMDNTVISYPTVNAQITGGEATIEGDFTLEECKSLADKINAGALPFKLQTENFNTLSPTLGMGAKDAMVMAGFIAFGLIAIFMIVVYRLPGFVASIALVAQVAGTIAAITGFFPTIPSFTLTLPGIAGIILAIGIGVDANVITTERIREELRAGKTLDAAIDIGFKRGWSAIFDGNITVIIVAVVLMGAFGAPGTFFAKMFSWAFFLFGPSTAGTIYSFGYTLMVGVILNFLCGVLFSRLMLKSLSRFQCFRKAWLYGGEKA
ncbi:SecD/SecF family protein translocase subunit [Clostridiaceae bacterium NSJ-31]|uniref:Protein translocase subunit SecD n=1 Tax=Ligaoa zhengdingensis TaxID=2763658 RepID=A0A926I3P0_9FIRM|nr:SecD/SecF family protein translocase subunit [Ligaoa zhengdingensis]MBC8545555.1 SecD/SecF family protein translocase subunit [Ligaoa zhengdingensis]